MTCLSSLKTQPWGPNISHEAQLLASRRRRRKGAENSPYLWKQRPCFPLIFKHNLLRQGTGTADHLTLLQLLKVVHWPEKKTTFLFHIRPCLANCLTIPSWRKVGMLLIYKMLVHQNFSQTWSNPSFGQNGETLLNKVLNENHNIIVMRYSGVNLINEMIGW